MVLSSLIVIICCKPALAEAVALHYADATDAKLQTLTEVFNDVDDSEWLGYQKLFETNMRKTSLGT